MSENTHASTWVVVVLSAVLMLASCGGEDAAQGDAVRFCEVNRELEGVGEFTTARPEEVRDLITRTRTLLAEAEQTAPAEIRDEVGTTTDAYRAILDFYADADFDVSPDVFEVALASGEIGGDPPEAAAVFGWIDANCGEG